MLYWRQLWTICFHTFSLLTNTILLDMDSSFVPHWHIYQMKLNSSSSMESIYFTTVTGFGMAFHQTDSLKPLEWSVERVQVVLLEQHKTHKQWRRKPIVNMQLWHWWCTYRWWLRKKPCQKNKPNEETRGRIVSPCTIRCLISLIQRILTVTLPVLWSI